MAKERMLQIVIVAGVRPHYIKCAALQHAIGNHASEFSIPVNARYVNMGQHYDYELADIFIDGLNIHFDHSIQHKSKDPLDILGNSISQLGRYLRQLDPRPDFVVVMGDSNPALAGAVAASQLMLPIAHFEAGTAVDQVITPEVLNGKTIAQLAGIHFCSSSTAAERLRAVNITEKVYVVGDMNREFLAAFAETLPITFMNYLRNEYVLVTIHHQENLQDKDTIENLLSALQRQPRPVVFVTHPRTKRLIEEWELTHNSETISYISPLSYRDMLAAIKNCAYVLTDSGGLQREAYYLKKRCVVRLDVDFWPDYITAGIHRKVGSTVKDIEDGIEWGENSIADPYPEISAPQNAIFEAISILIAHKLGVSGSHPQK